MDLRRFRPYHLKLFLSNKYAYAQIAKKVGNDHAIVAAASTIEKGLQEGLSSLADKTACARVGKELAERAAKVGIQSVAWERKQGQRFHGKIAALINGMQEAGLKLA